MGKRLCLVLLAFASLPAGTAQAQQVVELESLDTLIGRSTGNQAPSRPNTTYPNAAQPRRVDTAADDRASAREARRAQRAAEQADETQQREIAKQMKRQLKSQERFTKSLQFPKVKPQRAPKRVRTLPPTANRY